MFFFFGGGGGVQGVCECERRIEVIVKIQGGCKRRISFNENAKKWGGGGGGGQDRCEHKIEELKFL